MSTVIIDIETVSQDLTFEQTVYLAKDCKAEGEKADAIGKGALYPLTGKIVCVGMVNPETGKGLCTSSGGTLLIDPENPHWIPNELSESAILGSTWHNLKSYSKVVTFNGRSFDIPYLMIRSAILNVAISRNDLMGQRFSAHPHCDLLEQLSFYGATRRMSLDMYCRAFGIQSPKVDGCDGSKVGDLHKAGKHQEIAEYCAGDVRATAELYKIWLKRMGK